MYIKQAVFTNFGRHRRLELNLSRGLIGLIGPNGSGKSTITDGIYAALTNDFRRFAGVKNDNICLEAGGSDNSSIYLVCEHEGETFEIYRGLQAPVKSWMKINGQRIENATRIEQELRSRLLNLDLLDSYVFVPQWEMFRFLSQTPGERAAAYQQLCGTQQAQAIIKAIDTFMDSCVDLSGDILDNSDDLRQKLGTTVTAIEASQAKLQKFNADILPNDGQAIRITVQRWTEARSLLPQIKSLKERVTQLHAEIDSLAPTIAKRTELLREAEATVAVTETAAADARKQLDAYTAYDRHMSRRDHFRKELTRATEALTAHEKTAPAEHPMTGKLDDLLEERGKLAAENTQLSRFLADFEQTRKTACPTCGTPVTSLQERIVEAREKVDAGTRRQAELFEQISAIRSQRDQIKLYQTTRDQLQQALNKARLDQEHEQSWAGTVPSGSREELAAAIDDHETMLRNLSECRKMLQQVESRQQQLLGESAGSNRTLKQMVNQYNTNKVSDVDAKAGQQKLERHTAATAAANYEKQLLATLTKQKEEVEEELTNLASRMNRQKKSREFVARLREVRAVMHPQALPQYVAQRNLQAMEHDINRELDAFGSPFWVEVSDDLSFVAHPAGRTAHRAERLSGGQKSVLAICFRTAICSLFNTQLDMLSLDEPTAGMDDENKQYLATALTRYAAQVRGNRQVFLITHASELRSAFDQVIDLGAVYG